MADVFIPTINCGYLSGENPSCWDGQCFDSEEECDNWIEDHKEDFSATELGGCVYSQKVTLKD